MQVLTEEKKVHKEGYKLTKLGWIPKDWEITPISEMAEILGGFAFNSRDMSSRRKSFQVIKMSNVYRGELDLERNPSFIENISEAESKYHLKKNDIILTLTGTVGKKDFGYATEIANQKNLLLNQRLCKFSNKPNTYQKFLFYSLKSSRFLYHFFLAGRGGTGNQSNVGINDIKEIEIPLPPLPEQRAIADCLGNWDKAIQATTQLIAQKKLHKKWQMQQLLTGKKRLQGFSGEWKEVRMDDVFERVKRKNTIGNQNVVTISAQRGFVRQQDFFKKVVASETLDNYFLVKKGEFCYNKSYSNGYPWGATKRLMEFSNAVVTTLYICFAIRDEKETSGDFFEQFFEANLLDRGLTQIAHEGGRAHGLLNVTPTDFFNLKLLIPGVEEQTAIAQVLTTADKEIDLLQKKLTKLKEQKKGLMQVLLTGKKRLKYERQN